MRRLVAQLREQQTEAARLDTAIADNLEALGFWDTRHTAMNLDYSSSGKCCSTATKEF